MCAQQTCFVVMGFGKKTDYGESGARTLDLDATYHAIIKPAVEDCGLSCIRSDEVLQSGVIDVRMYEMLLRADLVVADISTANANAMYELGVRHALRPFRTIVIKEEGGKFHFDLNHLATLQYRHLGEDIGASEAAKKREALAALIRAVMAREDTDSPVFTHLAALGLRAMSESELNWATQSAASAAETLASVIDKGRAAAKASQHAEAARHFRRALELESASVTMPASQPATPGGPAAQPDPFIIQQLALATYKSQLPDAVTALLDGWAVISRLSPAESTDPETLGIAGAIQKRLYTKLQDRAALDRAIELYGRGFELKRDYYNGENYALCLDLRAKAQEVTAPDESLYDRLTARKARAKIYELLQTAFGDRATAERADFKWMLATMANVLYALCRGAEAQEYETRFKTLEPSPVAWEVDTFNEGKRYALTIAEPARL